MKIKNALSLLLLLSLSSFAFSQSKTTGQKKPDIILILADDLGYGELGCYGNTFNETPNLDILASQGILFTQGYTAAPVCSPTRASIMTGQYPARVGITDFLPAKTDRFLDPAKFVTVNRPLQQVGYHTGIIGKWHLDTDFDKNPGGPAKHGFNEVIGTETKYIGGGDYFYPYDKISTFTTSKPGEYLTDRQFEEADKFIDRNKDTPFFLYLSLFSVHARLDAPEDLVAKYKKKFDAKYGEGEAEKIFGKANHSRKADHIDNPYLAAMLERIDAGVGNMMEKLKKEGLADNTMLIFFSDNGGDAKIANNGILRGYKTWLYEGGIRDNLIMRWPGKVKQGIKTDVPVSSIDFYPTFLSIAGATQPAGQVVDGKNLVPLLTKGIKPGRDALFWHYPSETNHWANRMASAVRKGDFKLLEFYKGNRIELYNLKNDPSEKENLASVMPAKRDELLKLLEAWKKEVNAEKPVMNAENKTQEVEGF